jgi:ribosomal protein S18 acetylase RimI-like enzyme
VPIWNDSFVFSGTGGRHVLYTSHDYWQLTTVADLMLAERNGVIQGTVTLIDPTRAQASIAGRGELEITRLSVAPAARRQGIGRILLACVHGEAVRRGAGALVLWTHPAQIEARDLYRSLGYQREPARDRIGGDGQERLVYRLAVQRSGHTLAARQSRGSNQSTPEAGDRS